MMDAVKSGWGLLVRLAQEYFAISQLKIKIIGFSNKRTGLFTRLGEGVYRELDSVETMMGRPDTRTIIDDIDEAEREIKGAEKQIELHNKNVSDNWALLVALVKEGAPAPTRTTAPTEPEVREQPSAPVAEAEEPLAVAESAQTPQQTASAEQSTPEETVIRLSPDPDGEVSPAVTDVEASLSLNAPTDSNNEGAIEPEPPKLTFLEGDDDTVDHSSEAAGADGIGATPR